MTEKRITRFLQDAVAIDRNCGECTMRETWRTASSQKPRFCKLDQQNIFCPIYGEMLLEWEEFWKTYYYAFMTVRDKEETS